MRLIPAAAALGAALALTTFPTRADDPGAAPAKEFKEKLEVCAACHGEDGVSKMEGVPSLAGEPDFFTEYQLLYFRGETRKNEQMMAVARDLQDDDIRDLGAYYASLPGPPAPAGPDPDPALTTEGAALVKDRHCAQCHLPTFVGQGEIGRLAGQREEAIVKALHDYQHGERRGRGNVIMPEIAYSMTEDDIKAVAHFVSRQPGK
jgi:cytochrome c553